MFTGIYRSGINHGQPRVASRFYPNTACLLTRRNKKEPEENRYIWGVFMVRDDFVGAKCEDGIIRAHDKYQIFLSEQEREQLLFWKYFEPAGDGAGRKWGTVEFKYLPNPTMARILGDICRIKYETDQRRLCEQFIEYFCGLNKIDGKALLNHR